MYNRNAHPRRLIAGSMVAIALLAGGGVTASLNAIRDRQASSDAVAAAGPGAPALIVGTFLVPVNPPLGGTTTRVGTFLVPVNPPLGGTTTRVGTFLVPVNPPFGGTTNGGR